MEKEAFPAMPGLSRAWEYVRSRAPFRPRLAVVLGSGLDDFVDTVAVDTVIDGRQIPDFPAATVSGHRGRMVFARLAGVPLLLYQGRYHYYEGHCAAECALPVRLARLLGCEIVVLTNAAGGINADFRPGDFMLLSDHLSFLLPSPLRGPNCEQLGPRFPDMSEVYDRGLRECVLAAAREESIPLRQGVYIQTAGPNFETPAEIRFYRLAGADAVGMSTVLEAIAARHCGLRVCGLSCIANLAAGMSGQELSIEEVQVNAVQSGPVFRRLLRAALLRMAREALPGSEG